MKEDIFEDLKTKVGCEYISDLKTEFFRERAKALVAALELEAYPLHTLSDMAGYLYDVEIVFSSAGQARSFFEKSARQNTQTKHR